jgi:hypothetical protein
MRRILNLPFLLPARLSLVKIHLSGEALPKVGVPAGLVRTAAWTNVQHWQHAQRTNCL